MFLRSRFLGVGLVAASLVSACAASTGAEGSAASDLVSTGDAGTPPVVALDIVADNECQLHLSPTKITGKLGTGFFVDWQNEKTSSYPVDLSITADVTGSRSPVELGLEPGNHLADTIRRFCFTAPSRPLVLAVTTPCSEAYVDIVCEP